MECEIKLGHDAQAIKPLTLATQLNKGIRAKTLLAQAYHNIGEFEKSLALANLVLLSAPNNKIAKAIVNNETT